MVADSNSSRILRQEGQADVFVLRSWSPELDFEEVVHHMSDDVDANFDPEHDMSH